MIREDTMWTLKGQTKIRIGKFVAAGGEGIIHYAVDERSGMPGVFKVFKQPSPERLQRTKFLVGQRLNDVSELFCAPIDYLESPYFGHFAPLASGPSLEEYLQSPTASYPDTYKLAIAVSFSFALLGQSGISHGDPSLNQFHTHSTPGGLELRLIDFDNFNAPGVPPPMCLGQEDRMAPELRRVLSGGPITVPDDYTDRFALTTILHDMLLARHVAAGFDETREAFERAMSGGWPTDPIFGVPAKDVGGFPSQILNSELAAMMRGGLSREPGERLSATDWTRTLHRNFSQIWVDPRCGGPSFIDPSRTRCPICGQPFPTYRLVFPALHVAVACDSAALALGRSLLGSAKVSGLHAVIRRYGQETRLEVHGRNGTYRWNDSQWMRLEQTVILNPGDRLRFADVECLVEETA